MYEDSSYFSSILLNNQTQENSVVQEQQFSIGAIVALGIITLVLIIFSSFFSASETAITSITKVKWKTESVSIKSKKIVNIVYHMINNYTMTLGTILIGNTLVNTASSTIAGLFFSAIVKTFGGGSDAEAIGTGVATGIMTLLVLIFGEFLPKNFAKKNSIKFLVWTAYPIQFFYFLFWPFTWILNKIFNRKQQDIKTASEEELKSLVEVIKHEGTLDSQEALIIHKAILFDDILIKQKMVCWDHVVKVNENDKIINTLDIFNNSGFSRLVVIDDDNEVKGIVHIKSVMKLIIQSPNELIKNIMQVPLLINQKDTLYDGLRLMQVQRIHMGVVVDDMMSQKPIGIITLENITEELTGNVYDETDYESEISNVQMVNETTWKVDAKVNAKEFIHKYINKSIEVDDDITINKYISKLNRNKAFKNRQLIDTPYMYIETFKDVKSNKFIFLIEKKIIEL